MRKGLGLDVMSDPMAMLDLERRTGIKNNEVDDFVKKADALHKAISGMKDGTLDPKDVSLKKYGILTEEEERVEQERREKNRREMAERVRIEKEREKKEERERWWEGAAYVKGEDDLDAGDGSGDEEANRVAEQVVNKENAVAKR